MEEFFCLSCGAKLIANSNGRPGKYCNRKCANHYRFREQVKQCYYNESVFCRDRKCDTCGWDTGSVAILTWWL